MSLLDLFFAPFDFLASATGFDGKKETPDIEYKLAGDLKIVREQHGLKDHYPQYILYRRLDGSWSKRASVHARDYTTVQGAKATILDIEKRTYDVWLSIK